MMEQDVLTIEVGSGVSFDMVYVEGGPFFMGSDEYESERPIHSVNISPYYMAKHQVTQWLWEAIMGDNPSVFKGENRPIESVSWLDAHDFIKALNEATSKAFRLPSEAEWEYAARGGKYCQDYSYAGSDNLKQVGWFMGNSGDETHKIGLLLSNELGIYDMSGSLWEWCEDDWHHNYEGAPNNGGAWIDRPHRSELRLLRGGSCNNLPIPCRIVDRHRNRKDAKGSDIGFRLVLLL